LPAAPPERTDSDGRVESPGARGLIAVCVALGALQIAPLGAQPQQAPNAGVRVGIVLGNAPAGTDEPTAMQTGRCLKAFELYKSGAVNRLLVTGGFTRDYISEARMMKIALVTYGAASDDVLEEELAATTNRERAVRRPDVRRARLAEDGHDREPGVPPAQGRRQLQAAGVRGEGRRGRRCARPQRLRRGRRLCARRGRQGPALGSHRRLRAVRLHRPMPWPTPQLARRLRIAAALYHKKVAPNVVLYNDRYTRGPSTWRR